MEFSPWDRPPLTAARPDSTMGGENALWEETDMDIQGLQKMTLLDYPGRVACTVFLGGCDLRCPFCHNGGLVLGPMPAELDSEELLAFLRKRRGLLDGVCVTGGEPLLRPDLPELLSQIKELGYPVLPEVGQDPKDPTTKVLEFPVKAHAGRVKGNVTAIEQLENYKMLMEHYVDHNCSITVHVRENEWEDVEQWVWDHWGDVVALSFLSCDDSFYALLPYEEIDQAEYERRKAEMSPFNPALLN